MQPLLDVSLRVSRREGRVDSEERTFTTMALKWSTRRVTAAMMFSGESAAEGEKEETWAAWRVACCKRCRRSRR